MSKGLLRSEYGITAIKKAAVVLFGFFSVVILARYLGPELRAEYAVIMNWVGIGAVGLDLGVSSAYQGARRSGGLAALLPFIIYSVTLFVAIMGGAFLAYGFFSGIWGTVALLTAIQVLRLHLQTYHLVENLRADSLIVIVTSLLYSIGLAALLLGAPVVLSYAIGALFLKEAFTSAASLVGLVKRYRAHLREEGEQVAPLAELKIALAGASPKRWFRTMPYFLLTVVIAINYKVGLLILEHLGADMVLLGIFAVGIMFADYLFVFSDVFKDVQISRTARGGSAEGVAVANRSAVAITLAAQGAFVLLGYPFVLLVLGSEFRGSYAFTVLMLAANIFMIPCKILGSYLISVSRVGGYLLAMTAAVVINISLNFLLFDYLGVYAAIVASIAAFATVGVAVTFIFCQVSGMGLWEVTMLKREDIEFLKATLGRLTNRFRRKPS